MKIFYRNRLLRLAEFLDTLSAKQFSIQQWVTEVDDKGCGTVCCAVGWAARLWPENIRTIETNKGEHLIMLNGKYGMGGVQDFFGIDAGQVTYLFMPSGYHEHGDDPTPAVVAARLRDFVAQIILAEPHDEI